MASRPVLKSLQVAGHGIHVTLVEPLTFATDLGTSAPQVEPMPEYDGVRAALMASMQDSPFVTGDPAATADALLAIVDAPNPPLRVLFGSNGIKTLRRVRPQDRRAGAVGPHLAACAGRHRSGVMPNGQPHPRTRASG